jgi:hypothetical protein
MNPQRGVSQLWTATDGSVQCINCEIATALGYMVEFRERAQGRPKEKAP